MSEIIDVDSSTGEVLGSKIPKNNPVSPDGVLLSHHFSMVLKGAKYLNEKDRGALLSALGVPAKEAEPKHKIIPHEPHMTEFEGGGFDVTEGLSFTSVNEEIGNTLSTLKHVRHILDTFQNYEAMEVVRILNVLNASMKSIRQLLPELSNAKHSFKIQEALVAYGKTLEAGERNKFMSFLREALTEKLDNGED